MVRRIFFIVDYSNDSIDLSMRTTTTMRSESPPPATAPKS
jgi:hypothetical protein